MPTRGKLDVLINQIVAKSATLADLCAATGSQPTACDSTSLRHLSEIPLGPITSNSREIRPGDVFWAIHGPRFRGEDFVVDAFNRGAIGAVVPTQSPNLQISKSPNPTCPWLLAVDDTHRALNDWARYRRSQFAGTAVAVTGSAGKTTTRQMIHQILQSKLKGTASPRNFNNHFGLPLSITAIEPSHDYAVLEMGANHSGEIAALAQLARPDIGVITCVGDAHLGLFGSKQKIAEAKCELLAALPANGRAVLGDDPCLRKLARRSPAQITWVGTEKDCDLRAFDVRNINGRLAFRIANCQFLIPVCGRQYITAALAAVAVGEIFGFDLDAMARTLYKFRPLPMRCQVQHVGDISIINDAYNSNPTAMRAALEVLRDFASPGRRIVISGDMGELGDRSAALHRDVGRQVVELAGAGLFVACGQFAKHAAAGARNAGMPRGRTVACETIEEALPHIQQALLPGDVVLVKGSRMMAMERIVDTLLNEPRRRVA